MKRNILIALTLLYLTFSISTWAFEDGDATQSALESNAIGSNASKAIINAQIQAGESATQNTTTPVATMTLKEAAREAAIKTATDSYIAKGLSSTDALKAATSQVDAAIAKEPTLVYTTEEIPGAKCTCVNNTNLVDKDDDGNDVAPTYNCGNPKTRKYVCEVGKGLTSFQSMFREITKWVVYIVMLLGVFAIVGAGIMWAWGSDSEEYTKKAKGWVTNILIGLVILFTFRYILGFLAPWIFQ